MNLKRLLTTPLQQPLSKGALALFFVIAALGFVDAAYLTVEHYVNAIPPCSIGSCETVLTSPYSSVFGIPVSLLGAIFFFLVLILLKIYVDSKKEFILRITAALTVLGAIISLLFIWIMLFVIHAICIYCMTSDILTVILSAFLLVSIKKAQASVAQ
jgi:uncharacterized membrane protein